MADELRRLAVIDCETDPFKRHRFPKPFLWGFFNGDMFRTFTDTKELVKYLSDTPYDVYAHNGGKFDYHFILDALPDLSEPKIIHGRLAQFEIGKSRFRDSYNIIPVPLSAYKKDEVNYDIFEASERKKPENWKIITEYLKGDCTYLYDLVADFRSKYGNGLTLAGSALKQWRRIMELDPPRSDGKFYDEIAPWYFGGRVECFHKGAFKQDFNIYDINSAYPYAMCEHHIFSTDRIIANPSHKFERVRTNSLYHVTAISNGAFPQRKSDGGLWFPRKGDGEKEFHVTGWEYAAALRTGTAKITSIIKRRDFARVRNHKPYVDYFYEKRMLAKAEMEKQKGDKESQEYLAAFREDLLSKLHLNGCYGKFGSRPDAYMEYLIVANGWSQKFVEEFNEYSYAGLWPDGTGRQLLAKPLADGAKIYYNVALAASITGYVRAFLWEHMCKIRAKGGRVLYCDTDSLSVAGFAGGDGGIEGAEGKAKIREVLSIGDRLGQWKDEGEYDYGAFCGKKLYACHVKDPTPKQVKENKDWKTATKGVRLTRQEIIRVALGETVTYEPEAPTPSVKMGNMKNRSMKRSHKSKRNPNGKRGPKRIKVRDGSFSFSHRQVKMTV